MSKLGMTGYAIGDYEAALAWYEKSVALKEKLGDQAGLAASYNNLGHLYAAMGRFEDALSAFEDSLRLCKKLGLAHRIGQVEEMVQKTTRLVFLLGADLRVRKRITFRSM